MKVAVPLIICATSIGAKAVASKTKLRGAEKRIAVEEDVAFWMNMQRNLEYMSVPDRPLEQNSLNSKPKFSSGGGAGEKPTPTPSRKPRPRQTPKPTSTPTGKPTSEPITTDVPTTAARESDGNDLLLPLIPAGNSSINVTVEVDATVDINVTLEVNHNSSSLNQSDNRGEPNKGATPSPSLTFPYPLLNNFISTSAPTDDTLREKGFVCPEASFVGCTSPNRKNPENECETVGEPCDLKAGQYCCQDNCPRNYCTARNAI